MDLTEERIFNLDTYLGKVISTAYRNNRLICNPVISRNPFSSSLLMKVLKGNQSNNESHYNILQIAGKFARYYTKNIVWFAMYFLHFLCFRISKLRYDTDRIQKTMPLIVINTFMMIDRILPKGKFEDMYFGDLYKILDKRKRQFIVTCFLFASKPWNLVHRIRTYNILSRDNRNFVTEFDLMDLYDWFELLKFIIVYPFETLQLTHKTFGEFDNLFHSEIINTLSSVQFFKYVRYMAGRQFGKLTRHQIKLIGWYENQVIDKLLFKGIRESGINSLIYGCQFFDKTRLHRNLYPLVDEVRHDVLPDHILVSGRLYCDEDPRLNVRLGISPRYNYLFDINIDRKDILNRKGLLVLLTYSIGESKHLLKMVDGCLSKSSYEVTVKLHPNHVLSQPFRYPDIWKSTEEDLGSLCPSFPLVVTSGTSSALEAAVMGCSVIIVGNDKGLTFNPMPEYGKGKIWDMVFDSEELIQAVERLSQYRQQNLDEIVTISQKLRDMFFTKATEQKYIDLFEL